MYRIFIIEYAPMVLLMIVAISATVRIIKIASLKHADSYTELFLRSFFPYSRDEIKNTCHDSLRKFYKANNKFNNVVYMVLGGILVLYILMHIIS